MNANHTPHLDRLLALLHPTAIALYKVQRPRWVDHYLLEVQASRLTQPEKVALVRGDEEIIHHVLEKYSIHALNDFLNLLTEQPFFSLYYEQNGVRDNGNT